jgi:hypothetical protein
MKFVQNLSIMDEKIDFLCFEVQGLMAKVHAYTKSYEITLVDLDSFSVDSLKKTTK